MPAYARSKVCGSCGLELSTFPCFVEEKPTIKRGRPLTINLCSLFTRNRQNRRPSIADVPGAYAIWRASSCTNVVRSKPRFGHSDAGICISKGSALIESFHVRQFRSAPNRHSALNGRIANNAIDVLFQKMVLVSAVDAPNRPFDGPARNQLRVSGPCRLEAGWLVRLRFAARTHRRAPRTHRTQKPTVSTIASPTRQDESRSQDEQLFLEDEHRLPSKEARCKPRLACS